MFTLDAQTQQGATLRMLNSVVLQQGGLACCSPSLQLAV